MEIIAGRKNAQISGAQPQIAALHALSSGWAEQHKEHRFGTRKPQFWWLLFSRSWVELPIHYFLIEHRDGPVLFDTGLDPAIASDPNYIDSALGRFLCRRIFKFHISEDDRLDRVLTRAGFTAGDIDTAVISHLHFDHIGGIAEIPQAELLLSALEWAQLSKPHPEHEWILREHIEIPDAEWRAFEFEPSDDSLFAEFKGVYDVRGDGSMILLPTPGHTPGSVSLLVRQEGWPPILLVADAAYEAALLMSDTIPGTGDPVELRSTYANIRQLKVRLPDLVIVPSHDPASARLLENATTQLSGAK